MSNRHTIIRAGSGRSVHGNKDFSRRWHALSNSSSHARSSKTGNTERKSSAKDEKPYVDNRAYRHGKVTVNREFEYSNKSSDPEFSEQRLKHGKRRNRRPESHFSSSEESRSRSRRRGSSRRHMKPQKYNGQSFEKIFVQFNNCSKYNEWEEEDKLAHSRWYLTGSAAQLLWDSDGLTYKQLVKKLRSRFGGDGIEEKFQTGLQCRRRVSKESLRELGQDVRRLMILAYPGENLRMAEQVAREHFIVALDDPELELKVRETETQTLDDAIMIAQRLGVFKSAIGQSSHIRNRVNRQVTEFSRHQRSYDIEDRVANIEQNLRLPQCDEAYSKLKQSKKNERMEKQKGCAASKHDKKHGRKNFWEKSGNWKPLSELQTFSQRKSLPKTTPCKKKLDI